MSGGLKLAIFDCDGTLVDSQYGIVAAMAAAFEEHNLPPPPASAVRHVVGLSLDRAVAELVGAAVPMSFIRSIAKTYSSAQAEIRAGEDPGEILYEGILDALEAFAADGWLMAVATGKSRRGLAHVLDTHDIRRHFQVLRTADDGLGKPDPTMIHEILAETGAAPGDTVMIGDTVYDIAMARAARVFALGVDWGYHDRRALEEAGAHGVVEVRGELKAACAALLTRGDTRETAS